MVIGCSIVANSSTGGDGGDEPVAVIIVNISIPAAAGH